MPLTRGVTDQSVLKAIITMLAFQQYPKEVANHNLLIAESPSFEPLTLGPEPSPAQTARALADTGLSIEEAADAIEYVQSWIQMCSQRSQESMAAHSLFSFFQAARAIPRVVPPLHIPYAWSKESERWRPVWTESALEADTSAHPGGDVVPPPAGGTGADPVDSTNGTAAVGKPDVDDTMSTPT